LIGGADCDNNRIRLDKKAMSEALLVPQPHNLGNLADELAAVAIEAGAAIMRVYKRPCAVREKIDCSPVTEADEAAEAIILARLARLMPHVPVVAEEAVCRGETPPIGREFLLVDALDGTREFLKQNGEFTVNIALVRDGEPICGVVFAPAMRRVWLAGEWASTATLDSGGRLPAASSRKPLRARPRPESGLVALASRSHGDAKTEAFLASLPVEARRTGGSSVKFCLLAQGEADVYARFSPTMEWDTAAGDAVLRAAGGVVEDLNGRPLTYGKQALGFRNPNFVAWGGPPV
jgi:3'(2'), 5'-bisphosphate nucleotidase